MQYRSFDRFECTEWEDITMPGLDQLVTLLWIFFLKTKNFYWFFVDYSKKHKTIQMNLSAAFYIP